MSHGVKHRAPRARVGGTLEPGQPRGGRHGL